MTALHKGARARLGAHLQECGAVEGEHEARALQVPDQAREALGVELRRARGQQLRVFYAHHLRARMQASAVEYLVSDSALLISI